MLNSPLPDPMSKKVLPGRFWVFSIERKLSSATAIRSGVSILRKSRQFSPKSNRSPAMASAGNVFAYTFMRTALWLDHRPRHERRWSQATSARATSRCIYKIRRGHQSSDRVFTAYSSDGYRAGRRRAQVDNDATAAVERRQLVLQGLADTNDDI